MVKDNKEHVNKILVFHHLGCDRGEERRRKSWKREGRVHEKTRRKKEGEEERRTGGFVSDAGRKEVVCG